MRSMRRNAFIEKNNMLLLFLLLLFVLLLLLLQSKKNITRYICLLHCLPPLRFTPLSAIIHTDYMHIMHRHTQWAKFLLCPLCSHLAAASSVARTQGYCQACVWRGERGGPAAARVVHKQIFTASLHLLHEPTKNSEQEMQPTRSNSLTCCMGYCC